MTTLRVGDIYKRLEVIKILTPSTGWKGSKVQCECECGNEKITYRKYLIRGQVGSCGCLAVEQKKAFSAKRWSK